MNHTGSGDPQSRHLDRTRVAALPDSIAGSAELREVWIRRYVDKIVFTAPAAGI